VTVALTTNAPVAPDAVISNPVRKFVFPDTAVRAATAEAFATFPEVAPVITAPEGTVAVCVTGIGLVASFVMKEFSANAVAASNVIISVSVFMVFMCF